MNSDYLFPHRLSRRDFLKTGAAAAAAAWAAPAFAQEKAASPVTIGSGKWTYTLDETWGRLPAGMSFGLGCGIVVDGQDRVIVTTRSANPCVAIFDRDGKLLETWSQDFAQKVGFSDPAKVVQTAHCIYWSKEKDGEYFYFTENVAGGKDGAPRIGARVYKTDLQGKVLYTIGNVESEGSTSQKFDWTNPTDVAVAPNGDIYVVDGYGSQRVSRFDRSFKHLRTIGGRGKEPGQFATCHGVWVSTLGSEPEIYIADRQNNRLQVFSPELDHKRTISGDFVRNPCCFYQHAGHLYIPDLASVVTILDAKDQPVAMLGDGKGIEGGGMKANAELGAKHPDKFFAPHALTVDSQGNIYVVEWVSYGRVRKLRHTPA
jgi:peptidylamidoglycolate lyase